MTIGKGAIKFAALAAAAWVSALGTPHEAAAQTASPIVLGVIQPFTGPAAQWGEDSMNSLNLVMKQKGDSVDGHPFKFVQLDDQCTPSKAVDAANRMLGEVVAFLGPDCSGDMAAAQMIMQKAKIPHLCPCFLATLTQRNDDYFFRSAPSDLGMMQVLLEYIKSQGVKKLALAYDTSGFAAGEADAIRATLTKVGLAEPALVLSFDVSTTDFSGQIGRIKAANVDALLVASYPHIGGLLIKQARETGLTLPIFGGAIVEPELLKVAGSAAEGMVLVGAYMTDDPTTLDMTNIYRDAYHRDPTIIVSTTVIEMYALEDIFHRLGPDLKGTALRDALRAEDLKTPGGMAAWAANGDPRQNYGILVQVKDGHFKTLKRVELQPQ